MFCGKSLRELEKQSCRRDIQICEGLFCWTGSGLCGPRVIPVSSQPNRHVVSAAKQKQRECSTLSFQLHLILERRGPAWDLRWKPGIYPVGDSRLWSHLLRPSYSHPTFWIRASSYFKDLKCWPLTFWDILSVTPQPGLCQSSIHTTSLKQNPETFKNRSQTAFMEKNSTSSGSCFQCLV